MIISFLNQKGGVGKTTLSINAAYALADQGYKVILADSDPQRSSMAWASVRNNANKPLSFNVIGIDSGSMRETLTRMKQQDGYDFIVIDGAPRMTDLARAAIIISDLVVMPMQASGFDLWATDELKSMIEEAKIYKPEIIHAVLLNRVVPNTNLAKDVLADMQENGWTFFDTVIGQRQNFANAATQGLTVFEVTNSKAAQDEILFMVDEILKLKD